MKISISLELNTLDDIDTIINALTDKLEKLRTLRKDAHKAGNERDALQYNSSTTRVHKLLRGIEKSRRELRAAKYL